VTTAHRGASHEKICPVSFAQQRLWLLDRLDPGTAAYNIARAMRMRGALSIPALRESLAGVVARHESLRTTFADVGGEPVQVIAAAHRSFALPTIDLTPLPAADREANALGHIRDEAQRPFDLATGPLMRAVLLKLGDDEHILLLLMHHIVTDGWSMSILFKEITELYEAAAAGRPASLPSLPMQYADFARWQRASLTADVLDRHLTYWRRQLAGLDGVLELPLDRPRPAQRTARGGLQRLTLPMQLANRLREISRAANATMYMTLLAAFQTLLWRHTGAEDIVVGSATAGRREVEQESLVGFFVNTLTLRTKVSGAMTFSDLLERVREVALEAYAHQDIPFEKLIEELNLPRSLNHTPLFQVLFIMQNIPKQIFELPGLTLDELEFDIGTAKTDLTLEVAETDEGLYCALEYSTDLFEPATATRLLGRFRTLLEGIAADPQQRLSALPLLETSERQQLLVEWNDTAAPYPHDQCIHHLFEAQAARTPEAVALLYRDTRLTYGELNARANQLARHLRSRGVGRGLLVGVCIERSIETIVALLGILKAGAAYVPLNPAYPPARIAYMLQDCRAPVLLTVQRLVERAPKDGTEIICVDTLPDSVVAASGENFDSGVGANDLAYVIYTSGSTGLPKGVLASHRGTVNRFAWMWTRFPFTPTDVCCQKTALSFVDSIWEIFVPLLRGVPGVIIPDEVLQDPAALVEMLAAHRVTRIVLVPSLLRLLLDSVPEIGARIPALKFWVTSGEALPPELARRTMMALPGGMLVNLYGSSEVAGDSTVYVITERSSFDRIPIGRPIANTQVYVLDAEMNPVPIGVAGEIFLGGDGVSRGYLHNPELTAKKFVPDRFRLDPGARLYATGDHGRFRADGNLEYLGRIDDQVKVRGIRIELGEIEAVLSRHPSVQAAAAAVIGDGERLVAYIVPRDGAASSSELRRFMRETVPDYMVPSSIVLLSALPMTPSGKVNRRALPKPDPEAEREHEYVAPRNPTEQALADIMAEVLGLDRVGVHDNFFELGGHSLLGIRVVARVRKAFRVELPLRRLFEEPTVAALAPEIASAPAAQPVTPAPRSVTPRDQLLAQLAGLSDAEVEALLRSLPAKQKDTRVTEEF
jgi:amino acid adenylation domain-containing protein